MSTLLSTPEFISAVIALIVAVAGWISANTRANGLDAQHKALQQQVNGGVDARIAAAMQTGLAVHAATGDTAAAAAAAQSASHLLALQQGASQPAPASPPGAPRPPVVAPPGGGPSSPPATGQGG